ncbi:MAG: ABC transporter substrate-binding protein [Dehalococcoidia bacterium]|nr:ABC transporter substrate-binding protein [Dehalococcoidia bacterium]
MRRKLTKVVGLVVLAVLVAAVPVLGGCEEENGETAKEVVIGYMGDFTGPAAATCVEIHKGLADYFKMVEEDDPIPDLEVKIITYDTKMDYSRAPMGYEWLKGQGADIFFNFSPIFQEILVEKHQRDKIPSFTFASSPAIVGQDWVYTFSTHYPWEAKAAMKWILEDWWPGQEKDGIPKVGHIGASGYVSTAQVTDTLEELHELDPTKFELEQASAPPGTMTWAVEFDRLEDCDILIVNLLGPQTASFLKEAILKDYSGTLLGTSLAFLGFWYLVKATVPQLDDLDGALSMQTQFVLTDDVPFINQMRANLERFRPSEADTLGSGTSYVAAQAAAMVLADTIRRAAAEVGPENVDSLALNNALKSIDITVEGYGEHLKCHEGSNILHRMLRVVEYRAADDDWYAITEWFLPPA